MGKKPKRTTQERICPACGSLSTKPEAVLMYERICSECGCRGLDDDFNPAADPLYSWHIIEHEEVFQVVEVKRWQAELTMKNVAMRFTHGEAQKIINDLKEASRLMGRDLDPYYS